ncbi:hypothetical protein JIP62_06245 [Brevundimonas vitis]|uniref:Mu-like prophage FluMu protein gp28 n=1 Tax=Brevundimonas vitisensis TaxID=2800818 RepID=A0ABX7BQ14_9CAUL|nr:hypothetical protein [Brevundimonas vitisensis]QQQ19684.1 hypothetical protein JIP62_06245 [Brevundimonas vitisensis]
MTPAATQTAVTTEATGVLAVLLPYQQELLACKEPVVVFEKSRRIGISWAAACEAVLVSSAAVDGMDTFYIGFEKEMTRGFIDDCAFWAGHFKVAAADVDEFLWDDSDKDGERSIQAFRIKFASGHTIVALTSRPRNLRSKQGFVILDEAAFMDDLPGMLKAAFALLIWGGRVWIISTHDGVDNAFNQLVEDCRALKKPFRLFRTTFKEALAQGLYKRICEKTGKTWSPEAEAEWEAGIRKIYAPNDAEELDVIPAQGSGVFMTRNLIESCATAKAPVLRLKCPPGFDLLPKSQRRSYIDAWLEQVVAPEVGKLNKRLRHVYGHDFARSGDISAFVPMAIEANLDRTVPFVVEMRNVPHEQQKQVCIWIVDRLPRFSAGKNDANGNGNYLGEAMQQEYGEARIEKVMPTQGWYRENMPPVKAAFEDKTIAIPADEPDLVDDLRQIIMIKGVPMVPSDAHTEGADGEPRHGDFAVGLCLAHAASRAEVPEIDYRAVPRANALDNGRYRDDDDDFSRRHGGAFARRDEGRAGFNKSKGAW